MIFQGGGGSGPPAPPPSGSALARLGPTQSYPIHPGSSRTLMCTRTYSPGRRVNSRDLLQKLTKHNIFYGIFSKIVVNVQLICFSCNLNDIKYNRLIYMVWILQWIFIWYVDMGFRDSIINNHLFGSTVASSGSRWPCTYFVKICNMYGCRERM